jgi:ABC-type uncharacterized transport system ATPase subunit
MAAAVDAQVNRLVEDYLIKTQGTDVPIRQLFGGNIQRAVLAREFMARSWLHATATLRYY